MTNYVPTTGVIRAAYQISRDTEDNLISFHEFHSWLEQHDAEIVAKAEERIIKQLETHAEKELARLRAPSTYIVSEENYAYYEGILEAVSVIKGEQK